METAQIEEFPMELNRDIYKNYWIGKNEVLTRYWNLGEHVR